MMASQSKCTFDQLLLHDSTDVRSCTKVFQHCIKKQKKQNKNIQCQRNCMVFTIDASLLPLIHYVHISLWFTMTVVTEWNPYAHVTLQLYRELQCLQNNNNYNNNWLDYIHSTQIKVRMKMVTYKVAQLLIIHTVAAPLDMACSHALGKMTTRTKQRYS